MGGVNAGFLGGGPPVFRRSVWRLVVTRLCPSTAKRRRLDRHGAAEEIQTRKQHATI